MNSRYNWYCLYTKQHMEETVASKLTRKHIECYVPIMNKRIRNKNIWVPLFQSYVFVRVKEEQLSDLIGNDGIVNTLYSQGQRIIITDEEISMIKNALSYYKDVLLEKFNTNFNDPLKTVKKVTITEKSGLVKINLPSLRCSLLVKSDYKSSFIFSEFQMPKNNNLKIIFNKTEFSTDEIAKMIIFLSDLYKSVGGDELEIQKINSFEFIQNPKQVFI